MSRTRSKNKSTITKQTIVPNLWFDSQAEEAARLYTSLFKHSKIGAITSYGKAGFEVHHMPEGTAMTIEFTVEGRRFVALNGGPLFRFNPSISFLVACDTKQEVDRLWAKLSEGGTALMELGEYPFSQRYGWTTDRYGLSWQVMHAASMDVTQRITPTLMYVGKQSGHAEEAINLYTTVFKNSKIGGILRYGRGEEPDAEGTIKHAEFTLNGQGFAAMDSAFSHDFTFNEAISLIVECNTQKEIDHHWASLTSGGGEEGMCGWLKDRFGVSWQVTPTILTEMLKSRDKKKVERVTNAFLKMKKLDISDLKKAYG